MNFLFFTEFRFGMTLKFSAKLILATFICTVVSGNLLPGNIDGLKNQFQSGLTSFSDISSLHYAVAGLKEFSVQSPDSLCNDVKRLTDKTNIESIYHGSEAAKVLNNCQVKEKNHFAQKKIFRFRFSLKAFWRRISIDDHERSSIGQKQHGRSFLCRSFEQKLRFPRRRVFDRKTSQPIGQKRRQCFEPRLRFDDRRSIKRTDC